MTKIPSVEERAKVLNVRLLQRDGLPTEKIREALTAEREAGAREVLLSIQKIVAESRTVEEEYGIGNREATARAQVIADIQALTPPTNH